MNVRQKIKLFVVFLVIFCFCFYSGSQVKSMTDDQVNDEVKELNKEIKSTKDRLEEIEQKKEKYASNIRRKQSESASLNNQLSILENRLAMTEIEIESIKEEISKVNLEMKKVNIEIANKEDDIEREKKHIANILKLMYKEGDINTLEILLLNDSLADFLNKFKYLEDINKEMAESLDNLKRYKRELEKNKVTLDEKSEELLNLKNDLEQSLVALEDERNNKNFILEVTRNSEIEYQNLLALAKQEQEEAALEIAQLEKDVRERMLALSGNKLEFNDDGLIWPVPKNYITAYFHDPEYPFRYLFEHPGVDVRAKQGTSIKAAASGYVARVKINGTAYGYIMLIHGDGISTVYGHTSKSYVTEDDYVVQGQVIGASGGLPGTTGAGRLSTGAHLHFEVRLNGIPVNPLEYLP